MLSDSFLKMERNIDLPIGQVSVPLKIPLTSAKIWLPQTRQVNNEFQTQIVPERLLMSTNLLLPDTSSEYLTSDKNTGAETLESSNPFIPTKDYISLWRLILYILKRLSSAGKNWLKEDKVYTWLKFILHGTYLIALESIYLFIYILHFFRAFLTLIKYFSDQDNKNLVEAYKFMYACFKIFISLLMLAFIGVMIAHGVSPFNIITYQHFKILFYLYSNSKLVISAITLGLSYRKTKNYNNHTDHAWLKENYRNNIKKHLDILFVAGPITISLLLISLGVVTGPGFYVALGVASLFLLIDAVKAIYYYKNPNKVAEPEAATLNQQNPFINVSINDYYYRKCRCSRLEIDNIERNRIYLLKEIVVKIRQLQAKLTASRVGFFSERSKLEKKIEGLKQVASHLFRDDYKKNEIIRESLVNALQKDYQRFKVTRHARGLLSNSQIENLINEFKDHSSDGSIFNELLHARDRFKEKFSQKNMTYSQSFKQSFFKSKGDCEDILNAYEVFKELQQKSDEKATCETNVENTDVTLALTNRFMLV